MCFLYAKKRNRSTLFLSYNLKKVLFFGIINPPNFINNFVILTKIYRRYTILPDRGGGSTNLKVKNDDISAGFSRFQITTKTVDVF